jgi:hypothetical protein
MPPAEFERAISTSEWPQIHALDRAATGISMIIIYQWHLGPLYAGK